MLAPEEVNIDSIWVCFVTKNNFETAQKTVQSIFQLCKALGEGRVRLLVLDKSDESKLGFWLADYIPGRYIYEAKDAIIRRDEENQDLYARIGYELERDSIQRARIQMMLALRQRQGEVEGIIWQIDDDMLFVEAEWDGSKVIRKSGRDFFGEIRAYKREFPHVDAAIGKCTYAPPLPILLYFLHQLEDLLLGRGHNPVLSTDPERYHDLYFKQWEPSSPIKIDRVLLSSQIEAALRGMPLTRPILSGSENPLAESPQPTLLRGANFIIFNRKAAECIPHLAFQFDGLISRRGDMVHAWMLSQMGFQVREIQLSLFHNRDFPSIDIELICTEYLRDALGAIAFRYLVEPPNAMLRYESHLGHLQAILALLGRLGELQLESIDLLSKRLGRALARVETWKGQKLLANLEKFKKLVYTEMEIASAHEA